MASSGTLDYHHMALRKAWAGPQSNDIGAETSDWDALTDTTKVEANDYAPALIPPDDGLIPQWLAVNADPQTEDPAGIQWDGVEHLGLPDSRRVLGLLIRRDDGASSHPAGFDVEVETPEGIHILQYRVREEAPSSNGNIHTIPLLGDATHSSAARWQLWAVDPAGDLAAMVASPFYEDGLPMGRILKVRTAGAGQYSFGGMFTWERLPERIYTAALGEWSLYQRWYGDDTGSPDPSMPVYDARHHHSHRNGRLDVVGFSPHDSLTEASRMQQFGPYGDLVAEGYVTPQGEAVIDTANLAAQSGTARSRMLALGLTSKQFDPESKLYYFGYRWYSPELMRWTQKEPLGLDGPNLWHFGFGNPSNGFDPNGLTWYGDAWEGAKVFGWGALNIAAGGAQGIGAGVVGLAAAPISLVNPVAAGEMAAFSGALALSGGYQAGSGVLILASPGMGWDPYAVDPNIGSALTADMSPEAHYWGQRADTALAVGSCFVPASVGGFGRLADVTPLDRAQGLGSNGGRLGKDPTREHILDIQTELRTRGWDVTHGGHTLGEEYLAPLGGGRLGGAYPDITASRGGHILRINTVDVLVDGVTPTARELRAAAKIRMLRPGDRLLLIPKRK